MAGRHAIQQFYDAFNTGRLQPLLALVHPDFVYRTRQEFPGGGAFGLEAALERISALRDLFDDLRWEPQEFIDGGGRTLVVVRQVGRGHASGAEVDGTVLHVWLFEDEKAKELSVYSDRGQALEALGLSE